MKKLFGVGLGIFVSGIMWMFIQQGGIADMSDYVIPGDKYYILAEFIWNVLPWIIIILGVIFMVLSGKTSNPLGGEQE